MTASLNSKELIERWHRAVTRLESAKQQVSSAECDMLNAETALGKHLCPKDAELDEQFSMWVNTENMGLGDNERILIVTKTGDQDYSVRWRKANGKT